MVALDDHVQGIEIGSEVIMDPGLGWEEEDRIPNPGFHILGMPVNGTYAQDYTKNSTLIHSGGLLEKSTRLQDKSYIDIQEFSDG